jgi:hypothetical protein
MFDTALLKRQPWRYVLIAESILPPLLIFIIGGTVFNPGKSVGESVQGRPDAWVFGIVWFLIVVMLLLALVLVALNTVETVPVCLIAALSFLSIMMCFLWLAMYKKSKSIAAQILLLAFAFMLATTVVSVSSTGPENPKIVSSLFFGLTTAWLTAASLFNYLEIQKIN